MNNEKNQYVKCIKCLSDVELTDFPSCNHKYCYLCIKLIINNNYSTNCKTCEEWFKFNNSLNNIELELLKKIKPDYIWLYSANYKNKWWCYDKLSNYKLELIYSDYNSIKQKKLEKTMNHPTNIISFDNNHLNDLQKITQSEIKTFSNDNFSSLLSNNNDIDILFDDVVKIDKIDKITDITDIEQTINSNEKNDIIKQLFNKENLLYILNIADNSYKIDLDEMKQINIVDVWKKRNIIRLSIPDNITNIIDYLKGHNVVGISGVKF